MIDNDEWEKVAHLYRNGQFQAASRTIESLRSIENNPALNRRRLALEADAALCELRATDVEDKGFALAHRRALRSNRQYLQSLYENDDSAESAEALLQNGFLEAIAASVWLHLRVNNTKMACHRLWDALQRLIHVLAPNHTRVCTTMAAMRMLHSILPSGREQSFRQLLHLAQVLGLVEKDFFPGHQDYALCRDQKGDEREREERLLVEILQKQQQSLTGDGDAKARRDGLLETLSSSSSSRPGASKIGMIMRALDCWERQEPCTSELLQSLLQHRSTLSERVLVGCLQGLSLTETKDAYNTLELTLRSLGEGSGDNQLSRVVLYNMAECCKRMGWSERALQWLLRLYRNPDKSNSKTTECGIRIWNMSRPVTAQETQWRCFHASVAVQDVVVTLAAAQALYNRSPSHQATKLAYVYALLGAERTSLVQQLYQEEEGGEERHSSSEGNLPLQDSALFCLYEAEAILCGTTGVEDEEDVVSKVQALVHKARAENVATTATIKNNSGIAHLLCGNADQALEDFRAACEAINKSNLEPAFNLTMLLWRMDLVEEAVEVWSRARGFEDHQGITAALHGAVADLKEKKNTAQDASQRKIGGIEASQVLLLDCIVLQCRVLNEQYSALQEFAGKT